jgi:HEAT repeat protein
VRAAATDALWMVTTVGPVPARAPVFDRVQTVLIERLDDADASVRLAAIHGLGNLGPMIADAPPAVLRARLNDDSEPNREAVFRALGGFTRGLPSVLVSLVRSLEQDHRRSRAALAKLLEDVHPPRFTSEAIPGLVAALSCRDAEVSRVAAASIAAFTAAAGPALPDVAKALDRLVEDSVNGPGTANRPDPVALVAIARCLEIVAPHARSQGEAVAALAKLLRPELDSRCRVAAANALGRYRPTTVLHRVLTERIDDHDSAVRVAVMWAFDHADFGTGFRVPTALAAALEDKSAQVRAAAAAAMGHSGVGLDPFIPALLGHAARDDDPEVSGICESVLGTCSVPAKVTPAIIPDLVAALRNPRASLREAICSILCRFGREAAPAVPAIAAALIEPTAVDAARYRWIAAEALGKIAPGTPRADQAVKALIESLAYQDWRGPVSSIRALADFGPAATSAIPSLERLRESNKPEVKEAATQSLAKIKGQP